MFIREGIGIIASASARKFRVSALVVPLVLALLSLAPVASARSNAGAVVRVAGRERLLVKFDRQVSPAARAAVLRRAGVRRVRSINTLNIILGSVPVASADSALVRLRAEAGVGYAEPDRLAQMTLDPNDTYFDHTTIPCESSLACWPYQSINLPEAWDATTGSSAVTVAVVDTGVDAAHPDLAGAVLAGYNFVAGSTDTSDDEGHGTAVAGVIASRINNGIGVAGVCGNCQILPVKVLDASGSGSTSNIALGITWAADHGAQVINLSLASVGADPAMEDAINYAISQGALVVAAAGNAGSTDPTACNGSNCGGYPAAFTTDIPTGLIAVAASDYSNDLYGFSNHGSWVSVAAPGCAIVPTTDGSYNTTGVCGTSIASPFVAGLAALELSYNPTLSVAAAQDAITSSASQSTGLDVAFGEVDAFAALETLGFQEAIAPYLYTPPVISGSTVDGATLTVSSGTWIGTAPIAYTYAWSRCDSNGFSCTALTTGSSFGLTAADVGSTLQATVTAQNGVGTQSTLVLSSLVAAKAPRNTRLPAVASNPVVGDILSPDKGAWTGAATITYAYQWQSSTDAATWTNISGSSASLTVTSDLSGQYLRVDVTASNSTGSQSAYSAPSNRTSGASVSGGTGGSGGGSGSAPSSGSSGGSGGSSTGGAQPDLSLEIKTDAPPALNAGVVYRLRVFGKIGWGATDHATATFTLPDEVQITSVSLAHGPGCTQSGQTLNCDLAWVDPGQDVYVVVSGTVTKPGALTASATVWAEGELNRDDNQATLTQTVVDPNAAPPNKTVAAAPLKTFAPALATLHSKPLVVGSTLALVTAGLPGTPVRYQWQAAGANHRFVNVGGQTKATLKVTTSLVGKQLRVLVTVRNATGLRTITSKPTAAVPTPRSAR